jgi:allantoinase
VFLPDLVVRSRRILTPRGARPGAIHIRNGRIVGILDIDALSPGCPVDDVGDDAVLPGVVDSSVHVHASGETETASEGFARTTRTAAAGGVTTIVAAPFGCARPTTTVSALESTCHAAEGHCFADVGFWGGVVPGNTAELAALFEAGVLGFQCALMSSNSDGSIGVSEADLRTSMPPLTRTGALLRAHAELSAPSERATAGRRRRYATYLDSRPKTTENDAIALLIRLCEEYRLRTHGVHLSSSDTLTPIFLARSRRLPFSVDTCPHYLTFVAEEIPDGAVEYTCEPPIRGRENRELLWAALAGGLIHSVVSDHRPAALAPTGSKNFLEARSGIASLQIGLSIVWTSASARGYTLEQVVRWMCQAPAQLAGLGRKGMIDVGYDADLVVFDADALTVPADPRHGQRTPYGGRRLRGVVKRTYLRGARVYDSGGVSSEPTGRLLLPGQRS